MNLKMPILLQSVLLLLSFSTTNTRSGNGCRKKCEELWPNSTALQCTAVNCLMRSRGYNKREVPKGDPISNKKDDKDFDIPCCPKKEGTNSFQFEECETYMDFERSLSGNPVIVSLDFKVAKIFDINLMMNQLDIVMSLDMSWTDRRLQMCPCEDHGRDRSVELMNGQDDLWVPDLHIWEIKSFHNVPGLTRPNENIKVIHKEEPTVVYGLSFKATLDCHINTLDYQLSKNRCFVRFGSYAHNNTKIVFQLKPGFPNHDELKNSKFNFKLFPLHEKDKEVTRKQPMKHHSQDQDDLVFAYDGFQIIVQEILTNSEVQYYVSMISLVFLSIPCLFALSGHPKQIDRCGLLSSVLLGSILLLVQITDDTPYGMNPVISFIQISIGIIMVCFSCYCILVILAGAEWIRMELQHKIELAVFIIISFCCVVWLFYHFWTLYEKASSQQCRNFHP